MEKLLKTVEIQKEFINELKKNKELKDEMISHLEKKVELREKLIDELMKGKELRDEMISHFEKKVELLEEKNLETQKELEIIKAVTAEVCVTNLGFRKACHICEEIGKTIDAAKNGR